MKYAVLFNAAFFIVMAISCSSSKQQEAISAKQDSDVLYDQLWQLEYMSGIRITFEALFPNKKPELTFYDTDQLVRGNAGCNGYSAPFTKDGDNISFGDPGPSTMMYCGEGEQQFLNLMKKINRYSVDADGKLNLMIDDIPMMRFKKMDQSGNP